MKINVDHYYSDYFVSVQLIYYPVDLADMQMVIPTHRWMIKALADHSTTTVVVHENVVCILVAL